MSFYFVDRHLPVRPVRAPPGRALGPGALRPTDADRDFAQRFVDWNTIDHGIQRVDACRTPDGELLLVELEDLNPYLSLDLVSDRTRDSFVASMTESVHRFLDARPRS